jgi:hypothetical protein
MIPMPLLQREHRGARDNHDGYLTPMRERWDGPRERTPEAFAALTRWMAVDKVKRWQKRPNRSGGTATYCDHYAADWCEQMTGRALLSAWVWWTDGALASMRATGQAVPVVYGSTVREHGARGLYGWLAEFGAEFGWRLEKDASGLRAAMGADTFGLIVDPGHVAVALPDACGPLLGVSDGPGVLTSQAGGRNAMAWRQTDWYAGDSTARFYSFQGWTA